MGATVIVSVKKKKEKKNTLEMQSSQMLNTIGVFSVFYETLYSCQNSKNWKLQFSMLDKRIKCLLIF